MGQFPTGGPLDQSLYLHTFQPFSRLGPKHIGVTTLTFLGHVRDVISHVTIRIPIGHFLLVVHWTQAKSLSSAVFEIFGPKYIEVMTVTFQGHVTSSVTLPFDSQVVISYRYSIGTKSVSPTVVEIMGPKYIRVMTLTFLGHVTSSVSIYNKLFISHYN